MLIQKSEHKWVPVFFEQPSPYPGFSFCFISLFFCFFSLLLSCHKNISSLRAGTLFLCLPLSSYSLVHGRCSEICVEEVNDIGGTSLASSCASPLDFVIPSPPSGHFCVLRGRGEQCSTRVTDPSRRYQFSPEICPFRCRCICVLVCWYRAPRRRAFLRRQHLN